MLSGEISQRIVILIFAEQFSLILSSDKSLSNLVQGPTDDVQHGPWNSTVGLEITYERDFYVLWSNMDSTRFEPFNLSFRNHAYSTSKSWL